MRILAQTATIHCYRWTPLPVALVGALLVLSYTSPADAAVRRRLNVNSNPPGALVYVDNQQIGTTPCSVDFVYYGTREIRLIKPGFETLTVNQPIPAPWYEYTPIDFVSENLLATKIRDNRTVSYNLAPQLVVPPNELLDRAGQLRQDTMQLPPSPAAQVVPIGPAPAPVLAPQPSMAIPTTQVPEPLPGINPPPLGQPTGPPPILGPPPNTTPIAPRPPY
jgi:PEGA domain-containing protein